MNLYFVRHSYAENTYPDDKRNLSRDGIKVLENSIDIWQKHFSNLEYIITSPYTRAYQTAQIIADRYNTKNEVIIEKDLAPGANFSKVKSILMGLEADNILMVGHMPDIAIMASDILNAVTLNFTFKPGSIISVDANNRLTSASLNFFLPPVI